MARFAGPHSSKDDDDFGAPRPTAYRRSSPDPVVTSISLLDALDLVVQGRMTALELFAQLPSELSAAVDKATQAAGGKDFRSLPTYEQMQVMVALQVAIRGGTNESPPAKSSVAGRPMASGAAKTFIQANSVGSDVRKPWWKFW